MGGEFKLVNDTFGHHVGDELLVAVAERLGSVLRSSDTLCRLAGDEFAVLYEGLTPNADLRALAANFNSAFERSFVLPSADVQVRASIGIVAGDADVSAAELLRGADAEMYRVKPESRGRAARDATADPALVHHSSLNRDIREALAAGHFRNEYQPLVSSLDGRITGVEALLRWTHPSHGRIPPATVVPLAEHAGLIHAIGLFVLEQACTDLHAWRAHDLPQLGISVNVSPHQLMAPDFVGKVHDVLAKTGTAPTQLTLEVTESVFVNDSERALVVLDRLKDLGVALAIDDFGTGYSSLSYLLELPFDVLKIDRVFIAGLGANTPSRHIVEAIITLAHHLGMTVVAEGVESAAQHRHVVTVGCDLCQGFYFGRPASSIDIGRLLAASANQFGEVET